MTRPEIRPFADEHLDGAAALLAARHARHRAVEPLLPAEVDFRAEIEKERDELPGVVALDGGEVVGYLLGKRREDKSGRTSGATSPAMPCDDPELTRDLYAAAAGAWVDAGLTRHFVYVPAIPGARRPVVPALVRRLVSARDARDGAGAAGRRGRRRPREHARRRSGGGAARPPDGRVDARLTELLRDHSRTTRPPSSTSGPTPGSSPETFRHFVAERDGQIVGHILLYRRPHDLRVPADSIDLAAASTRPSRAWDGRRRRAHPARARAGRTSRATRR